MKRVNKIPIRLGMSGKYKIMVGKKPGGVESEQRIVTDWFPNLITNGGLDRLGSISFTNSSSYCQVGTGNTTPAFTDTQLASYLAYVVHGAFADSRNLITLYQQRIITFSFGEGVAAGNLTEIGVGWATSGSLFSRALILDGDGNPTTITVLSDEYLTVLYSYRIYGILADSTGSVTFTGDLGGTYGYKIRHGRFDAAYSYYAPSFFPSYAMNESNDRNDSDNLAYAGIIGAIDASPAGASSALGYTEVAYTPGTYTSNVIVIAAPAQGNLDDSIKSIRFVLGGYWQVEFDPVIPKTDRDSLVLTFELTWGRH